MSNWKATEGVRGLTLVETLVVIAVIGIIAVLAFPALSGARERAIQGKCVSNLRQISAAMLMWASDNNGTLPPQTFPNGLQWNNPGSPFFEFMLGKAGTANNWDELVNTVLRCPGSNLRGTPDGERDNSYGRNIHLGVADYTVDAARQRNYATPLTRIENHSRAALVADWPIPNFQRETLNSAFRRQNLWSRHNGRMCVAFVDGHVDTITRQQWEAWDGAAPASQEQRDFRMFLTGLQRNNPNF